MCSARRCAVRAPTPGSLPSSVISRWIGGAYNGGPVGLKIPTGTASGKRFRVLGRGAPRSGGGPGDLIVTVEVAVPQKLNAAAKRAVEELAEAMPPTGADDPRAHLRSMLEGS